MGWDDLWPWGGDNLPRTGEELGTLDGSPEALRAAAGELRGVADGLPVAKTAIAVIGKVVNGQMWKGEAFAAVREKAEGQAAPKPQDIDNAWTTFTRAAGALDTLARDVQICQTDFTAQKSALDRLGLAGRDIPDDMKDQVKAIEREASAIRDRFKGHLRTAETVFDELDDAPHYAKDRSGWNAWFKSAAHNVGDFFEGAWEAVVEGVKGSVKLWLLQYQPWKWPGALKTGKDVVKFAWEHPGEFGKALIDWDTLKSNPAKWLGKLAPTLIATIVTGGAAATTTRGTTLASRLPRLLRLKKKAGADPDPVDIDPVDVTDPDILVPTRVIPPARPRAIEPPETMTMYRFHDADNPESLLPNLRRIPRVNHEVERFFADHHMRGSTVDSPAVSVLETPRAGANTTDPWLQGIATGTGPKRHMAAPHLSRFEVPTRRLIAPEADNHTSRGETEYVFFGEDLADFHRTTMPNPYLADPG